MNRLEAFLRRQYAVRRGHPLPTNVDLADLRALAARKALDAVRGKVTGKVRRPTGSFFRSSGVRLIAARSLTLGSDVVLNKGVTIDASGVDGVQLGDRVTVGENARVLSTGVIREPGVGIQVGHDTAIGMDNILWGQGGIEIGHSCLLGPRVMIFSENHVTGRVDVPIRDQGTDRAPVRIGEGTWIGAGVIVVAGVSIGQGSVIAAGAVVTKDIPPLSVAAGVPARVIAKRGSI